MAAQFLLRGYCPLLGEEVAPLFRESSGKHVVLLQIADTRDYLLQAEDVPQIDDGVHLSDRAGFADVCLPASQFLWLYIVPDFQFHASMVYAIGRAQGVRLSKGDFDGFHEYPPEFSLGRI